MSKNVNRADIEREERKMAEKNKKRGNKKSKNRTECVTRDKAKDPQYSEGKHKVAPPVVAKNEFQKELLNALKTRQVIVCNAPAGVGKSYCAMSVVADWYVSNEVEEIKLARPAVGMGNTVGLLKGDLKDKYEPYLMPLIDVICKRYDRGVYETGIRHGNIELLPVEYLRGRNFDGVAIIDEAQNLTPEECYSILTRVGEYGKLIMIGDHTQNDLKGKSGIAWVEEFIEDHNLHEYAAVVKATSDDIVRSGFCKAVVKAKESQIDS